MNKNRFRRVFSKRLGMLVAVAENVTSQGKTPGESAGAGASGSELGVVSSLTATAALALLVLDPSIGYAQSLPTNGQVIAGQASISQNANTMNINQGSQRAVINWDTFNVGQGNTVQFNQPNAQAQALNRVVTGVPSNIQGTLQANGQVLIQNANGVLFGKGAVVNVGSLLATTKSIDTNQFMAGGPLQLKSTGTNAGVVNDGTIQAQGYVTLMGDQARNTGSITTAPGGQVVLAAGDSATVALANGQGIQLTLTNATANALAENSGTIKAENGSVLLTARGSNTLLNTVVNLDGVTRAGTVVADAGNTGDVTVIIDNGNSTVIHNDGGGNGTSNGTDNGGVIDNGGNTNNGGNANGGSTGSVSGGFHGGSAGAVALGAVGVGGLAAFLVADISSHWYLDQAQPLTLEAGDAAYWADAAVEHVTVDTLVRSADVQLLTHEGVLDRHLAYRDGADGVKHFTYEDEKSQTKADLSVNMQTHEFFYTESGVKGDKPTWVMLPSYGDWRWHYTREDSPWYPSARLFRRRFGGDWREVVARIRGHLLVQIDNKKHREAA